MQPPKKLPLLQPVRGMHDFLPAAWVELQHIIQTARAGASLYDFKEMMTPVVEYRDVFDRTVATSDIVTKEMFEIVSRTSGEESLMVLRPEGTAPLMRAVISEGLTQKLPIKFFYAGPMFRYDRPQKGRLRQFHQVGVEFIGVQDPWADIEVLACAHQFLTALNLKEQITLEINTLGDAESYEAFRKQLVDFLEPYRAHLSSDSQMRLEKNPLRILDSKEKRDQEILEGAPSLHTCLTSSARDFFEQVCKGLQALEIPYTINPSLVRGLDYYVHTAFEFKAAGLGAQSTVLAGGRYDGLSTLLGGPPLPGIGWAAGVERLHLLTACPEGSPLVFPLLPQGEENVMPALLLARDLRQTGIPIDVMGGLQSLGKKIQKAQKAGHPVVLILGEEERKKGTVIVKNLEAHTQEEVAQGDLPKILKDFKI